MAPYAQTVPLLVDAVVDRRLVPDPVLRLLIRRVVAGRLREQEAGGIAAQLARDTALLARLSSGPITVAADAANAQHYEVPAAFYRLVLGPHLKYSCAWWPSGVTTLADAERGMLELTMRRADLRDGQRVLELGCGWGSLLLFAAARQPHSRFVALSNSASQRDFIERAAAARGLHNISVVTGDIARFATAARFDRIVSVELLEHVRNHAALFERIASWLERDGRFFAHVFAHRRFAYPFESDGAGDWMARHFFTGGMMPSDDWLLRAQPHLAAEEHWRIDGTHYQRTAEAWLANLDRHAAAVDDVLRGAYGDAMAERLRARWRVFFLACAEMFGYRGGQEWIVSQYRFRRRL